MRYAFISHADADKARLKPLLQRLMFRGIPIWIDRPDVIDLHNADLLAGGIPAGADWGASILEACRNAHAVIFFLSKNSNSLTRSDFLYREYEVGVKGDKLVTVKIDDIALEDTQGSFRIRQSIDLAELFKSDVDKIYLNPGVEALIRQLRDLVLTRKYLAADIATVKSGVDALVEMVTLVGEDLQISKKAKAFKEAHKRTNPHEFPFLENKMEMYNPDATKSRTFTYFDIFNNICMMTHLRQDAAMRIREALKMPDFDQEGVNRLCRPIYDTLSNLSNLIHNFYHIAQELNDERYMSLPISMHKMLAETSFAINSVIEALGYDHKTTNNYTSVFEDEGNRALFEKFCEHLEESVQYLCSLNVRQR